MQAQQHRFVFERLRRAPGMYLLEETFAAVASFIQGYDAACEGGVLLGFREWLAVTLDSGFNLGWPVLILHAAFPDSQSPQDELNANENAQGVAIGRLFELLEQFDAEKYNANGIGELLASFAEARHRSRET